MYSNFFIKSGDRISMALSPVFHFTYFTSSYISPICLNDSLFLNLQDCITNVQALETQIVLLTNLGMKYKTNQNVAEQ